MKIGLVGGSYQEESLPFDAQRTVNLFAVIDQDGADVASLYGTDGLGFFATTGSGAVRGMFSSANGRGFVVAGSKLYELDSSGNVVSKGNLKNSAGNVSIEENGFQLAICDGINLYIYTYETDVFEVVTDADLPQASTVTYIDGYFVISELNSGKFYISALFDGLTWNALDFATAESSPDSLVRVYNAVGQLWLLGSRTTEIWTNTGDSAFPFERISGAKIEAGILAPHSAVEVDNSLYWLGAGEYGNGIVYIATGFTPQRISTNPIERIIQESSNTEEIRGFTYQSRGHTFYLLTGGGLPTTLVYDVNTRLWHERAYLNEFGNFEQHLAIDHMFVFGKHLVGDRRNGKIYELSNEYYDDDGSAILRERIYTHLIDEDRRISYNTLRIGFEVGVGLQTGQGSNPLCSLLLSKDGARTWSNSYTATIGAVGKYKTNVSFRRLGITEQMTFRLQISEPVKIAITGSYLNA